MARGSVLFRFLAALVLIGILVAAGVAIFNAGQAQGYALGAAASGQQATPPAPGAVAPYGFYGPGYWPGYWHPFFFPFFPFFGLFFLVLFFFLIGGIFRRGRWHHDRWYGEGPGQPGQPGQPPSPPQGS